jgi:hypothetical protein
MNGIKRARPCGAFQVERTGIEPVTFGLQTHPITRLRLTPIDRIGMTEPKLALLANVARHRWTAVRSHRARTAAAWSDNAPDLRWGTIQ